MVRNVDVTILCICTTLVPFFHAYKMHRFSVMQTLNSAKKFILVRELYLHQFSYIHFENDEKLVITSIAENFIGQNVLFQSIVLKASTL